MMFNIQSEKMKILSKPRLWPLVALLCLVATACKQKGEPSGYNPFVDSFVSGQISCASDIVVVLAKDVDERNLSKVDPAEVLTIAPSVSGRCRFADAHTLVFTPDKALDHAAQYAVTVNIGEMFPDAESEYGEFTFKVNTRPLVHYAEMASFADKEPDAYSISFDVSTSDEADSILVQKSVRIPQGKAFWSHHADKCHHVLTVEVPVPRGRQTLELLASDDAGDDRVIASLELPSSDEMAVVEVRSKNDFQSYVEVTFNKRLDAGQDLVGLAYIKGCRNKAVDASGNTLRLYPDRNSEKEVDVWFSGSIRSASGLTLGDDKSIHVNISTTKPEVKFASDGVIVPLDGKVTIPFSAVYLGGVRVVVLKIFPNNISTMLQDGGIAQQYGLAQFGRPVAVRTLLLDEQAPDLFNWHTFSLDLTDLVKAEPGAMYHVDLVPVVGLTAWPGADELLQSKEEVLAEDAKILQELQRRFDSGNNWYDYDAVPWSEVDWSETDDPAKLSYYYNRSVSRNVLATNIGLSAYMGDDNQTTVVALDLTTAAPISGANLTAYNYQNQPVATATTNSDGKAILTPDASKGRPFYVEAVVGDDRSYLRLSRGGSLSTSVFDVAGEQTQAGGLKGFIYGERGVWRPGDTLHLGFMLKDPDAKLPKGHPVTLEVSNPVGQLVSRQIRSVEPMGLYAFNVPTDADAPTGAWNAKVSVGGAVFEKRLRIETIKPNRLKIDLRLPKIIPSSGCVAPLHTEWLNGAQVDGLSYATTAAIAKSKTQIDGWDGYVFDDATREFETSALTIASARTDSEGNASIVLAPKVEGVAPGMLRAAITTRVFEPSGEFSVDTRFATISPYDCYVGIKNPQHDRQQLATGKKHDFAVAVVSPDGRPMAYHGVKVDVYKVQNYWWWSATDECANFRYSDYNEPVKTFSLNSDEKGRASFSLNFSNDEWGTYLIIASDAMSPVAHASSLLAYFDWPDTMGARDGTKVTFLNVATDKQEYAVGDHMKLSFPSSADSKALVTLCRGGSVLDTRVANCEASQTTLDVEITPEMTPNVYAYVSLIQPYTHTSNDAPLRLYGVAQASVTQADSRLEPKIAASEEFKPLSQASVTVSEQRGRPMAYTLAVVDEGLLDLTHFQTPDAWGAFFAREALGVGLWDLYDIVAGAYGGRIEQLFSIGGDDELLNKSPKAFVNRFTPMVRFYGPFNIGKGDKKSHKIDVPNYSGRVRLMVVATDGKSFGNAEKSVSVTKPLLVCGTMPRQIGVGDRSRLSATVIASKAVGNVEVSLTVSDGLNVVGEQKKTLNFTAEGDKTVSFDVLAGDVPTNATVSFQATCQSDQADYTASLPVRHVGQRLTTTTEQAIQPGKEWVAPAATTQGIPESAIVELSSVKPLKVASRVAALLDYPHGCAEQTTSKGLAQLYLADFTDLTPAQQKELEANVNATIKRLYTFATPSGGLSYWPDSPDANLWASAYAYVFFSEAESRGYFVQASVKKSVARYLASNVGRMKKGQNAYWASDDALALYALALDKKADMAAMNRSREVFLSLQNRTDDAMNLLAAAYAIAGRKTDAQKLFAKAGEDSQALRLIAQTAVDDMGAAQTAETLRRKLVSDEWMNTYDVATSLMAWARYAKKFPSSGELKAAVTASGKNVANVQTPKSTWNASLSPEQAKGLRVKNDGAGVIYASLSQTSQVGQSQVDAANNGLSVRVEMCTLSGAPLASANPTLRAGDSYVVRISVSNTSGRTAEGVAVSHVLPAGVEVLKFQVDKQCSNVDVRDDGILFYADELEAGREVMFAALLSATYAGHYYRPATTAESMYDNRIGGCDASGEMIIE